ncbi:PAS-domain containing protein [Croceicoccus gelatinilyticus]|uniref:PAS-domain containing protein n=1 Tax=Croceicoccus gelatinilyticus TaxID=2835536 RepID=UPI001BCF909F|nr:PAS-domain containing protein [Croceicoccus gelatinilyticus]MBS7669396.1 hybrid sensor histidine kinase/response regulator [Croceicoccus gelatinilyticus]
MSLLVMPMLAVLYGALLFLVAHLGDDDRMAEFAGRHKRTIFGLSLAVYCTSWTFYGAVGTAATGGWQFVPIYLGPVLMFTVFGSFVARVLQTGKAQHSTSIADFLSARYGKSAWVAAMVTIIALFGALPYMALQLKSVSQTMTALSPELMGLLRGEEVAITVAAAMAAFAMLFGTGRIDLTQQNRGVVIAIAFEAVVKLVALVTMAVFAFVLLTQRVPDGEVTRALEASFSTTQLDARFIVMTFLGAMAILCLPRQFHMLVVEARESRLVGTARWLFPAYLVVVCLCVLPVMIAGKALLPSTLSADMHMLHLPMTFGADWLALLAFIGGFSAATGMIIVTSIALSSMITNDLIVPIFFRSQIRRRGEHQMIGNALINVRRLVIALLLALAYAYHRSVGSGATLAGLGEIAFAGAAQFAPGLLLGFFWRKANRAGMIAGLTGGFAMWLMLLAMPVFGPEIVPPVVGSDPLVSGVVLSLSANMLLFVVFSVAAEPNLLDRVQSVAFIDQSEADLGRSRIATNTRVADFRLLLEQFMGASTARDALNRLRLVTARPYHDADEPDDQLIDMAERMISSIIGSSSARALVQSTLEGEPVSIEHVVAMFDETSQRLQFGSDLLQIAIENIDQGISVVDAEQRLVAWNNRYRTMFDLPTELVEVGRPIAEMIRFNMRQMGHDEAATEHEVNKRLHHLRAGRRHSTERELPDGRVLRILGNAAPGGGYVTSYTDITADREAEAALEAKVRERTQQLVEANRALESATKSKTRFLAAASHDLVQPMNAARLFASALSEEIGPKRAQESALLAQIDRSIETADRLLRALLDISRLDGGKAQVEPERFSLDTVFAEIENEFALQAEAKGLGLIVRRSGLWVRTDRGLFISVLQNLVTNAVRYTDEGRILVAARKRGDMAEIVVADQGRGIAEEDVPRIFEEFTRLGERKSDEGLGLGLAIVRRIAAMLGTEVKTRSIVGRGTSFRFSLPLVEPGEIAPPVSKARTPAPAANRREVVCIDNDTGGLGAVTALLERWGFEVHAATGPEGIDLANAPDLLLLDYRLDDDLTGDVAYDRLCAKWGTRPPAILLTAEDTAETKAAAERIGASRMIKPPSPPALRALINARLTEIA